MMSQIFNFWFDSIEGLADFYLQFDTGLGFSLGSLIIVSLIFVVVIRYFTFLGD